MSKCPKCNNADIRAGDIACPSCKTPVSAFPRLTTFNKIKRVLLWALQHLALPIAIFIAGQYILLGYINPRSAAVVVPNVIYNSGPLRPLANNSFIVNVKKDNTPWLDVDVVNIGTSSEKDMELSLRLKGDLSIRNIERTYVPKALEARVTKQGKSRSSFYEKLSSLPIDGQLRFHVVLNRFIVKGNEFDLEVLSENRNWSKNIRIEPKRKIVGWQFVHSAMAMESAAQTRSENSKSGVFIGGYDQLKIANDIFVLLQNKALISLSDAKDIQNTIMKFKEGVLVDGINVLKFNEMIMNKLIQNNRITYLEAQDMVEKSRNSGGVLIGGYNVLILEVEILNTLLRKGFVSREEGQEILDKAKG